MKRWIPVLLLAGMPLVHAAPDEIVYDDMDALLQEKGVISRLSEQIQQVRDNVGASASNLVINAMGFLGVPYRYGGNSAETGVDCSGLVRTVFEQSVGKVLPRRAVDQAAATEAIDRSELKPGDLVFFNTLGARYSHVGLYIGEGRFIHSPRAGASIRMEAMDARYWQTRFNGARRVNPELLARADGPAHQ